MTSLTHGIAPTPGMQFKNEDCYMTLEASTTATKGDCLAVDMTKVVTTGTDFRFYEMRAPVTADFLSATTAANVQPIMGIALEDQATAGGSLRVRFKGVVDALIEDNSLAIGAKLTPKNASRVLDTQATAAGTGNRAVAILLQATTTTSQIRPVLFDGMSGVVNGTMITNAS